MDESNKTVEINDSMGRVITMRPINVLDQIRLLRAIGPDQSRNEPYVTLVNFAASVSAIDGVPQPMPTNEKQIDALIGRLGDHGFAAISVYMRAEMQSIQDAAEAAANGEATVSDPLAASVS